MGYYINKNSSGKSLSAKNKFMELVEDGASVIGFDELQTLKYEPDVLICIADNGPFQAAAFIYSQKEFDIFYTYKEKFNDPRPYYWLRHPNAKNLIIMETWSNKTNSFIEMPENQMNFLNEIEVICKKYNLSISHEDHHGSFEIDLYNEDNLEWLKNANAIWI